MVCSYVDFIQDQVERRIIKKTLKEGWVVGKNGGIRMVNGSITKRTTIFNQRALVDFHFEPDPFKCKAIQVGLVFRSRQTREDIKEIWRSAVGETTRQLGTDGRCIANGDDGAGSFCHVWSVLDVEVRAIGWHSPDSHGIRLEIRDPLRDVPKQPVELMTAEAA